MSLFRISCLFKRYVTSLQRLCRDPRRIGNVDYGGFRICLDQGVAPTPGSVIYSYNHGLSQRFIRQMTAKFQSSVVFIETDGQSSQFKTFGVFNKVLAGHAKDISVVILKLNAKDFPFLLDFVQILSSVSIKQIILEMHCEKNTEADYVAVLSALQKLHASNYFIYWYDRNWNCVKNKGKINRYNTCWTINVFLRNPKEKEAVMVKEVGLPNMSSLGNKPVDEREKLKYQDTYLKYISKHQTLCKQMLRLGNIVDGGWDICHDAQFRPKSPCIVYSFGINYDFSFDEDVEKTYGCDVFCFDPSMKTSDYRHSDHIMFYNVGLGEENKEISVSGERWKLKTLRTIQGELGHIDKRIDVLKIDIEGSEKNTLPEMIASGALKNVVQLCLEFHHYYDLGTLRQLYDIGFRIFWSHQNPFSAYYANGDSYAYGMEVYFVNINLERKI